MRKNYIFVQIVHLHALKLKSYMVYYIGKKKKVK